MNVDLRWLIEKAHGKKDIYAFTPQKFLESCIVQIQPAAP
jgi:hypothetical protein